METETEELSYEGSFRQLEQVLGRLEQTDLPLEEALALYEKGAALAALCSKKLEEAELRVRQWQASGETKSFEGWQEA